MRLRLLGPPSLDGHPLTPGRSTDLIAALVAAGARGASDALLIGALWADELPEHPRKSLQVLISRLRSRVGDVIARSPAGYRLTIPADEIDVMAGARGAVDAANALSADDPVTASRSAQQVIDLWQRADTTGGTGGPLLELIADHLPDLSRAQRISGISLSRLGEHDTAAPLLAAAGELDPWDQDVRLEIVRGITAGAGSAAGLEHLESFRRALREELGLDPGPELIRLQAHLLRSDSPTVRTGVRYPTSSLLGREDDVRVLRELLRRRRLVSVVGAGGLGKTTLAHALGAIVEAATVVFVPLAGVSGASAVITEITGVLGVRDGRSGQLRGLRTGGDAMAGTVAALGPEAVLILDNCEQFLDDAADAVTDLLAASADLRVLVTSRAPLDLPGETVHLLPELDLATSMDLFSRRAADAGSVEAWSAADHAALRRLCTRPDGLPLAIELAAARTRVLSVQQIDQRLDDRFALLRGGSRASPERHRTLEAVIDWSWQLLDDDQRQAMCILSGFADGIGLEAAEIVLRDLLPDCDALGVIEQLVAQSMVVGPGRRVPARLRILETVREFAVTRTDAMAQQDIRDTIVRWAARGAAQAPLMFGPDPYLVIDWFREEQDNLVAALRWAIGADDAAAVQPLFLGLGTLWLMDSSDARAAEFTDSVFAVVHPRITPADLPVPQERQLRAVLSMIALSSMTTGSRSGVRAVVALRRRPTPEVTNYLDGLTVVLARAQEFRTFEGTEADLALTGSNAFVATTAGMLAGQWWENMGDAARTLQVTELIIRIMPPSGSPWLAVMVRSRFGEVLMTLGRHQEASLHFREAIPVLARIGARTDVWQARFGIALGHLHAGDVEQARSIIGHEVPGDAEDLGLLQPFATAGRAEILLASGDLTGLGLWREATRQAFVREDRRGGAPGLEPWALSVDALSVIAHLRHDARDIITERAELLCHKLFRILTVPGALTTAPLFGGLDIPVAGAVVRAVGL